MFLQAIVKSSHPFLSSKQIGLKFSVVKFFSTHIVCGDPLKIVQAMAFIQMYVSIILRYLTHNPAFAVKFVLALTCFEVIISAVSPEG